MTGKKRSAKEKNHNHRHDLPVNEKNLLIATLLNLVISIAEFTGGILSNSLALLSDALHNLGDTFATFIAYLATLIGKKPANYRKTFGFKRIEILAALLNAIILIILCLYLFKEAYERWNQPEPIHSMVMLVVAMIGLLANLLAVMILHKDAGKSINVKAAYVHLIGDSLSSVMVIIAGVLIHFFKIYWIDPIITVLIGLYIIKEAFVILMEAVNILMQSTPSSLNVRNIRSKVEEIPGINNIHHLHIWNLTDQDIHLEAHVELNEDLKLSEIKIIQEKVEQLLRSRFNIDHVTLQFEFNANHSSELIVQE
ncbi:MAG: cation transporter [Bacteroidales bacterium]|nr:cation transporter [Bacteroidales bacterium]MBN2699060.1 cation transporter [Bacteroidales bacterium]